MLNDCKPPIHSDRIEPFALFSFPLFYLPGCDLRKRSVTQQRSKFLDDVFLRFPTRACSPRQTRDTSLRALKTARVSEPFSKLKWPCAISPSRDLSASL